MTVVAPNFINPSMDPGPADLLRSQALGKELLDLLLGQQAQASIADTWCSADHTEHLFQPRGATSESRQLREKSTTPWLGLVEDNISQNFFVEGYRTKGEAENAAVWDDIWQPNRLDLRQIALHRSAVRYGMAYNYVSEGIDPLTKKKRAKVSPYSVKRMVAGYVDPAEDEFPDAAAFVTPIGLRSGREVMYLDVIDDHWDTRYVYDGKEWFFQERTPHGGKDVVPVVRFANKIDLEGVTTGEILPFIPIASRIDQDTFDRLIVQRYGAWKVRWATGLQQAKTDAEKDAQKAQMQVGDILASEGKDVRFGTLDGTPLDGYIATREADIRDLASVTQTPPHYLLGTISNLSAEALAAAEASMMRKVGERKVSFGESWEQTLRLGAHIMGKADAAGDYSSQVRWRDVESRSLAQVADALGKLATMLELPWESLVDRIPGWTDQDTVNAKKLIEEKQKQDAEMAQLLVDNAGGDPAGQQSQGGSPPAGGPKAPTPKDVATRKAAAK